MKYKINIQKFVENPKYIEQLEEYKKRQTYGYLNDGIRPTEFISTTAMDAELTEEEFKAIKKAVLEVA